MSTITKTPERIAASPSDEVLRHTSEVERDPALLMPDMFEASGARDLVRHSRETGSMATERAESATSAESARDDIDRLTDESTETDSESVIQPFEAETKAVTEQPKPGVKEKLSAIGDKIKRGARKAGHVIKKAAKDGWRIGKRESKYLIKSAAGWGGGLRHSRFGSSEGRLDAVSDRIGRLRSRNLLSGRNRSALRNVEKLEAKLAAVPRQSKDGRKISKKLEKQLKKLQEPEGRKAKKLQKLEGKRRKLIKEIMTDHKGSPSIDSEAEKLLIRTTRITAEAEKDMFMGSLRRRFFQAWSRLDPKTQNTTHGVLEGATGLTGITAGTGLVDGISAGVLFGAGSVLGTLNAYTFLRASRYDVDDSVLETTFNNSTDARLKTARAAFAHLPRRMGSNPRNPDKGRHLLLSDSVRGALSKAEYGINTAVSFRDLPPPITQQTKPNRYVYTTGMRQDIGQYDDYSHLDYLRGRLKPEIVDALKFKDSANKDLRRAVAVGVGTAAVGFAAGWGADRII